RRRPRLPRRPCLARPAGPPGGLPAGGGPRGRRPGTALRRGAAVAGQARAVARGSKTLLAVTEGPAALEPCAQALAGAVREGALGRITVEKADGGVVAYDSPLTRALESAGFRHTPRGLRLRG